MRFGKPELAIHDAYAINMTGKEPGVSGTAPIDSSIRSFNQVKAGLIMRAVEEQEGRHRVILQYCYAPHGVCRTSDANLLYIELLTETFKRLRAKKKLSEHKIAELSVLGAKVVSSFPQKVLSGRDTFTKREVAAAIGKTTMTEKTLSFMGVMENVLGDFLQEAIQPVQEVCQHQCEMIKDTRLANLNARIKTLNLGVTACIGFVNKACGTNHQHLAQLTHYDADILENQLDAVEASKVKVVESVA